MYDDVGCLYTLPTNYDRTLEAMGIPCQVFNRYRPVVSLRLNNRDHRKILVIDGNVGFTGASIWRTSISTRSIASVTGRIPA